MLTEKNYGKHSKWSRYQSQRKPTDPESWSYTIDDTKWPSFPASTVRIMSVNCLRFPKTFYSLKILANLIMSSHCDVAMLQEISTVSMVVDLLDFINKFLGSTVYGMIRGPQTVTNLQLSYLYKLSVFDYSDHSTLDLNSSPPEYPFPRLPFNLILEHSSFDLNITNVHLVSHHYQDNAQRRIDSFYSLGDYFDWNPVDELLLLGGDWNHSSNGALFGTYLSQFQLTYGSYYSNSDMIIFHKYNSGRIVKIGYSQYQWNYKSYCDITDINYALYFSDHKPIVLDLPI